MEETRDYIVLRKRLSAARSAWAAGDHSSVLNWTAYYNDPDRSSVTDEHKKLHIILRKGRQARSLTSPNGPVTLSSLRPIPKQDIPKELVWKIDRQS